MSCPDPSAKTGPMTIAAEPRRNFTMIQALRGLAASWVVLFHIGKGEYLTGFTERLPGWVAYLVFDYGSAGVAVFFVLSGFVISHGLTDRSMDARGFGHFVARRSIRLDPPYWASMALTISVGALYAALSGTSFVPPGAAVILGHVLYLQELLRLPQIELVYWTLTYEVQFYLVLAAGWWAITALIRRGVGAKRARLLVLGPLGALAFLSAALGREWAVHGLFVNLWHGFFLGVLAYEAGVSRRGAIALLALIVVTLLGTAGKDAVFGTPCALTALLLASLARTGHLDRSLGGRGWQFLGRISYSLYLVHVPIIMLGFAIWGRLAGRGFLADLAGLLVVGGAILAAAATFWLVVERPSHALSARLFRRPRVRPTVPA